MKLFSLKKNNDSAPAATTEIYQPTDNLANNPLAIDNLDSIDNSIELDKDSKGNTPVDNFSLDTLDLESLSDNPHTANQTVPSGAPIAQNLSTSAEEMFNFDDFELEFDSLSEPVVTTTTALETAPVPTTTPAQGADSKANVPDEFDTLDHLNKLGKLEFESSTPIVDTPASVASIEPVLENTQPTANDNGLLEFDNLDFGDPSLNTPKTTPIEPIATHVEQLASPSATKLPHVDELDFGKKLPADHAETISPNDVTTAATITAPMAASTAALAMSNNPTNRPVPPVTVHEQPLKTPNKKPWFGKKDKAPKVAVTKATTKPTKPVLTGKKPNNLWILLVPLVLVGAGAWYFLTQHNDAPTPKAAPVPIAKPKAPAASIPASTAHAAASTVASSTTTASTTVASAVIATASSATATAASSPSVKTTNTISPAEILAPELPKDPAIAKEEMDRLAAQSDQLKEQEKIIEDQLAMMNELSSKKEAHIKLLEQQVAQLEQQKVAEQTGKVATPAK